MTEREIADAIRAARESGRRVRVAGGGTSAVPPRDGALPVSTSGLRGIVDLRPDDGVVTVRAGTTLGDLASALAEAGCQLPLGPWDPAGRGTIGGAVAAGADGLVARDGLRWRDHVLGARALLASGEAVRVGASVVKSVAGYDVPKIFVSSRGTIAVIICLDIRIERIVPGISAWSMGCSELADVARIVACLDDLCPDGLVVSDSPRDGSLEVDVRFRRAVPAETLRGLGFAASDPVRRWDELTARASAPAAPGLHRRTGRVARGAPAERRGAAASGGWVADVLRGRATWFSAGAAPPPDPGSAALFDRVRRAFDPDAVLQPGRGYGQP